MLYLSAFYDLCLYFFYTVEENNLHLTMPIIALPFRWLNGRAYLMCGRYEVRISDWPNLTQRCKHFATVSTSMQVAV